MAFYYKWYIKKRGVTLIGMKNVFNQGLQNCLRMWQYCHCCPLSPPPFKSTSPQILKTNLWFLLRHCDNVNLINFFLTFKKSFNDMTRQQINNQKKKRKTHCNCVFLCYSNWNYCVKMYKKKIIFFYKISLLLLSWCDIRLCMDQDRFSFNLYYLII